jgi:hypothetical protein
MTGHGDGFSVRPRGALTMLLFAVECAADILWDEKENKKPHVFDLAAFANSG